VSACHPNDPNDETDHAADGMIGKDKAAAT
jgi:hypothetical protein